MTNPFKSDVWGQPMPEDPKLAAILAGLDHTARDGFADPEAQAFARDTAEAIRSLAYGLVGLTAAGEAFAKLAAIGGLAIQEHRLATAYLARFGSMAEEPDPCDRPRLEQEETELDAAGAALDAAIEAWLQDEEPPEDDPSPGAAAAIPAEEVRADAA